MKAKLYLFALIQMISVNGFSQAPGWMWARNNSAGGGDSEGRIVCTDQSGNSFVAGNFVGASITFGSTVLVNSDASGNTSDIFLIKYDPAGNVIWAISAGGPGFDNSWSLCADANGNVYMAGDFYGAYISLNGDTLYNTNSYIDIFYAMYDANANLLWKKAIGGTDSETHPGLTFDAGGNLILTGSFRSPSLSIDSITLTINGNGSNFFIARFDQAGNVLWAKNSAGGSCEISGVKSDLASNVIFTGFFSGDSISFDGITLVNKEIIISGWIDIFLFKCDPAGNVLWGKNAGGNENDLSYGLSLDAAGNAYIAGHSSSYTLEFDTINLSNVNPFPQEFFLAKYNSAGEAVWAKIIIEHSTSGVNDRCYITTEPSGNIYMTGYFSGDSILFGNIKLMNSSGGQEIFLTKYDPSGSAIWAESVAGGWSLSIAMDPGGSLFITGMFGSPYLIIGNDTLIGIANGMYIAKTGIATGIAFLSDYADEIKIYPVPSHGVVYFRSQDPIDHLMVLNTLGQNIFEQTISDNNFSLQMDQPGIYFISLTTGNRTITKKIIVQK